MSTAHLVHSPIYVLLHQVLNAGHGEYLLSQAAGVVQLVLDDGEDENSSAFV